MEQITKQKQVEYTVWKAYDGREFNTKEECVKYEDSAEAVLSSKYQKLIVDTKNAWELLCGYEDNSVNALKITTEEEANTVLQYYYLVNSFILADAHKKLKEKLENMVAQALEEKDLLLMGVNCDGDPYMMDTRNNIVNRLNNLSKKPEEV